MCWGVSGERNVSRSRRASKPRTPPKAPGGATLDILVDGTFHTLERVELHEFFKRRSHAFGQRATAAIERARQLDDEREMSRALKRLRKEMRGWEPGPRRRVRLAISSSSARKERRVRQIRITARTRHMPLPGYSGPIFDRNGRRGIFLDLAYDGAATNRSGVAARRLRYQFQLDHAELFDGRPCIHSNMGLDEDEIIACGEALEAINRAARRNAKVGINGILQCPEELDAAGRRLFAAKIGAVLDELGIAYCLTLHAPDPDGDQRNFHLHIWMTLRELERIGPYEWEIGEQLRTDLDGSDAMRDLRRNFADVATQVCRGLGHRVTYTHFGNAERGLPHIPLEKLGACRARKARRGEEVAANRANSRLIELNEQNWAAVSRRAVALLIKRAGDLARLSGHRPITPPALAAVPEWAAAAKTSKPESYDLAPWRAGPQQRFLVAKLSRPLKILPTTRGERPPTASAELHSLPIAHALRAFPGIDLGRLPASGGVAPHRAMERMPALKLPVSTPGVCLPPYSAPPLIVPSLEFLRPDLHLRTREPSGPKDILASALLPLGHTQQLISRREDKVRTPFQLSFVF